MKYVGFINKEADEPSKMGTRLSVPHREFFKAVVSNGPEFEYCVEIMNSNVLNVMASIFSPTTGFEME